MTALVISNQFPELPTFRAFTPGFSEYNVELFNPDGTKSVSLNDERCSNENLVDLELDLIDLSSQCSIDNWDGYGATAISKETLLEAIDLMTNLSTDLPIPEIVPEPDGGIGFEWDFGNNRILVISVNGRGIISYAGSLGSQALRVRGTETPDPTLFEYFERLLKKIIY